MHSFLFKVLSELSFYASELYQRVIAASVHYNVHTKSGCLTVRELWYKHSIMTTPDGSTSILHKHAKNEMLLKPGAYKYESLNNHNIQITL